MHAPCRKGTKKILPGESVASQIQNGASVTQWRWCEFDNFQWRIVHLNFSANEWLLNYAANGLASSLARGNPNIAPESSVVDVLNSLLSAKADLQAEDGNGNAVLTIAARNGHLEIVNLIGELLQQEGRVLSACQGNTAIMAAARNGDGDCFHQLYETYHYGTNHDYTGKRS